MTNGRAEMKGCGFQVASQSGVLKHGLHEDLTAIHCSVLWDPALVLDCQPCLVHSDSLLSFDAVTSHNLLLRLNGLYFCYILEMEKNPAQSNHGVVCI